MPPPSRRDVLLGTAFVLIGDAAAKAGVLRGQLPWHPNAGSPPQAVTQAGWLFFTADEAAAVEALADRIIPPDPTTPGGKDAGCAVYIDRQLSGSFGTSSGLYTSPPFVTGSPQQGPQSADPPAVVYRKSLAALDRYCRAHGGNKDMCGWKMIGYPGAHYDYRDWVGRHNERYPHPPVSIAGRPEWTPKRT